MRAFAVTRRLLQQFKRDKRTLALILIAPNLVLTLLALVFNGDIYHPVVGAVDLPDRVVTLLDEEGATVRKVTSDEADSLLAAAEIDVILSRGASGMKVRLEGSDPAKGRAVRLLLHDVSTRAFPRNQAMRQEVSFLHGGTEMAPFNNFGPVLLGFFVFFFTFIISGVSFVRERTTGTLERMLATPLRRWEIVAGYTAAFAVIVFVQSALVAWVSVYLLDMTLEPMPLRSFCWLLVVTLLLAATAMTLGMLVSAFARTEFQVFQFIPLVIVPQVFFSGLFPLETMSPWLRGIGTALPLTYGADAMRKVMIRNEGWAGLSTDLSVLGAFVIVFLIANVLVLRRYRSI